jgi:hypothetical protein
MIANRSGVILSPAEGEGSRPRRTGLEAEILRFAQDDEVTQ